MASGELTHGTILFVDDNKVMRDIFALVADSTGLSKIEVFEDADTAATRLKTGEEMVTAVLSDGLNGGWKQVIAAAKEARVPAFVLSTDTSLQTEVEAEGIQFIPKEQLSSRLLLKILTVIQSSTD